MKAWVHRKLSRGAEANRVRQIALGYTWTLGSRIAALAFGGFAAILIPRWLGPTGYGQFSWVISVASFFLVFADFGVSSSTARYVAQYNARKPESVPFVIRDGMRLELVFAVLFALLNWIAAPWIAGRFAEETLVWPLRFASFYIVATTLQDAVVMVLQGLQRMDLMALVSLAGSIVKTLLSVGLVFFGFGVSGAVVGQTSGLGVAVTLGAVALYSIFGAQLVTRSTYESFRSRIFAYGLPMVLIGISFYVYTQSDSFLIQHFYGAKEVGYYAMPLKLVTLMVFPAGALATTVAPMMAQLQERGENPGRLLLASIRYTLVLFVPLATCLFVLAPHFIRLFYGIGYLPSLPVFRIYMVFFVCFALSSVISLSLNFLGLAHQRARVLFLAAVVKVLLAVILVPLTGIVGAAVLALVTYVGVIAMYFVIIIRDCGVELRPLLGVVGRTFISAGAMTGTMILLSTNATTIIGFGLVVAAGGLVFVVLLLALGGVQKQDWDMLRKALLDKAAS